VIVSLNLQFPFHKGLQISLIVPHTGSGALSSFFANQTVAVSKGNSSETAPRQSEGKGYMMFLFVSDAPGYIPSIQGSTYRANNLFCYLSKTPRSDLLRFPLTFHDSPHTLHQDQASSIQNQASYSLSPFSLLLTIIPLTPFFTRCPTNSTTHKSGRSVHRCG